MQKILFEPGTPLFIYRLFQFSTVGLLVLLAVLYSQGKVHTRSLLEQHHLTFFHFYAFPAQAFGTSTFTFWVDLLCVYLAW